LVMTLAEGFLQGGGYLGAKGPPGSYNSGSGASL